MKKERQNPLHIRTRRVVAFFIVLMIGGLPLFAYASQESFLDVVKETNESFDSMSVTEVRPILQDKVMAKEEYQGVQFWVLGRKTAMKRFNCSNCHNDKPIEVKQGLELTHGDIQVNHGRNKDNLSCLECHNGENLNYLEDKKGRKIDFDHSYQLCGQCHFRQKSDWLGGAHGKRVSYWAGERVIYNCASCHNPHSPHFESRFPATYAVPLN